MAELCSLHNEFRRLLPYYVLFLFHELHSEEALASAYLLYHVPLLLHALLSAGALASVYMHTLADCITQLYEAIFSRLKLFTLLNVGKG